MPARLRYGRRFNAGTLQDMAKASLILDRDERAAFRKLHERREQLREENPEAYRRAIIKAQQSRVTKLRRHVPVTLPTIRGLEGC